MASDYITQWDLNGDVYDIHDADRGLPNGVATLDENGLVPDEQIPEAFVTSINGKSPVDRAIAIDTLPMTNKATWQQRAMFSFMTGEVWSEIFLKSIFYYKGFMYGLYATSTKLRIYKSTADTAETYSNNTLLVELSDTGIRASYGVAPTLYVCNDKIYIFYNTSSGCHRTILDLEGTTLSSDSFASTYFTFIRYSQVQTSEDLELALSYTIVNGASHTSYVGHFSDSTSESLALALTYSGTIYDIKIAKTNSTVTPAIIVCSINGTLNYITVASDGTLTNNEVDSGHTYNVNVLAFIYSGSSSVYSIISDTTTNKVYHVGISSSSVSSPTELLSESAVSMSVSGNKVLCVCEHSCYLLSRTKRSDNFSTNWAIEECTMNLDASISTHSYKYLASGYANGKYVIVGYAYVTNPYDFMQFILTSTDGRTFYAVDLQDVGASTTVTPITMQAEILNTGFCWFVINKETAGALSNEWSINAFISGFDELVYSGMLPSTMNSDYN